MPEIEDGTPMLCEIMDVPTPGASEVVERILDRICDALVAETDSYAPIWDVYEFVVREYGQAKRSEWLYHRLSQEVGQSER